MPQAVAAWVRQLGHRVFYATYYGQQDPKSLLPHGLDVVFVSTYTQASALAYALAKLYRGEKTLTVIGGPHAKAFPLDCLRFFDLVVQECDKALIDAILRSSFECHTIVAGNGFLTDIPTVEERLPEISRASFTQGRPTLFSNVPLLSSTGCPYSCDFCVDWNKPHVLLPLDRLAADLRFISGRIPGALVAYHDPNFGVHFDRVLETIENLPGRARNPYAMGCSLSTLRGSRLDRLKNTNCMYVGAGVESWTHYSDKAGSGSAEGLKKLGKIVAHFEALYPFVPSLGACFIFGTDRDEGEEPVELTKEFIRQVPYVWPGISIPVPYGGTPLQESCLREGRILTSLPFSFYSTPYLALQLKNYGPLEYYEKLVRLITYALSLNLVIRRLSRTRRFRIKVLQALRTLALSGQWLEMRQVRDQLTSDEGFRAFHEGRKETLPEFYRQRFKQRLGPYAELISAREMIPELSPYAGECRAGDGRISGERARAVKEEDWL
jgi:hypothetical protein